jgi:hypothetical protein
MPALHTTVFILLSTGLVGAPGTVPRGRASRQGSWKQGSHMASNASNATLRLRYMFSPSMKRFFSNNDLTAAMTIQENH